MVFNVRSVTDAGCVDVASGGTDRDTCRYPSGSSVMPKRNRIRGLCAARVDNVEKSVIRSEAELSAHFSVLTLQELRTSSL